MAGPYRESQLTTIDCPRCGRSLPAATEGIGACIAGCGVWVVAETAPELFAADELKPSRLTTWFRERSPCPHCSTQMTLRGHDMALFQGCDEHGFWIDADTVGQTGLGRPATAGRLARARAAADALKVEVERAEREAQAKARATELAEWQRTADEKHRIAELEGARAREELERSKRREPYHVLVHAAVKR